MRITPIDIQQQQFKSRVMGYDKAGVDHFLEILAGEMERLLRQNQDLQEELTHARTALNEMREREAMLKETLLTTQKVTDELKANARREAELLLADAELRAERVMMTAEERRLQLMEEIREIKRQRIDFETDLRSTLEKHLRMLELAAHAGEAEPASARSPQAPAPPLPGVEPEAAPSSPRPQAPPPRSAADDEVSFEIPLVDESRRRPLL
jgi:cell division initiation protein